MLSDRVRSLRCEKGYEGFTSRRKTPISVIEANSMNVETLLQRIGALVAERQQMRRVGARASDLETNRAEIARLQWELSRALIAQYLPKAA